MKDAAYWQDHINGMIIEKYQEYINGYVADFGCGDGGCLPLLEQAGADSLIGIDRVFVDANMIKPKEAMFSYYKDDLRYLTLKDDFVDNAICFHVLEHISKGDHDHVVSEFKRVMVNRGVIVVSVPYKTSYYMSEHVSFFDRKSLQNLFERNGFETIVCYRDRTVDGHGDKHNCVTGVFRNVKD